MEYCIDFDYAALLISIVLLAFYYPKKIYPSKSNRFYRLLIMVCSVSTVLDIFTVYLSRYPYNFPVPVIVICNMAFLLIQNYLPVVFMGYAVTLTPARVNTTRTTMLRYSVYIVSALLILTTPFTGLIFYINEERIYTHGPIHVILYLISVVYIIGTVAIIFKYQKNMVPKKRYAIYMFVTLTVLAMLVQFLLPYLLITDFAAACGCLVMYMVLQNPEENVDSETGFFSREAMLNVISEYVKEMTPLTVLAMIPDNAKSISTVLGFDAYNKFMREVGDFISHEFECSVFGIESESLAIVFDTKTPEDEKAVIDKISQRFDQSWQIGGIELRRTVSMACVRSSETLNTTEEILDAMNYAVTEAKRLKNGSVIYAGDIPVKDIRVSELEQQKRLLELESKEANLAKEKAERDNREKSMFLANMSHEIRTPMNAIIGMTDLILRDDINDRVRANANDIKAAGDSLLAIINDILDISKVESGKMELVPEEYDITKLISEVVSLVSTRIDMPKVGFNVDIDLNMPHMLYGDELRLRQIFVNILNNAAKFTKEGSITLKVGGEVTEKNFLMKMEVTDTGCGIRKEDINKLFDTFARIETEDNRHIEGTGLGLALVKRLLILMHGDIQVESTFGKGSTFKITIPQGFKSLESIRDSKLKEASQSVMIIAGKEEVKLKKLTATLGMLDIPYAICRDVKEVESIMENTGITHVFSYKDVFKKYADWIRDYSNPAVILLADKGEIYSDMQDVTLLYDPIYSLGVIRALGMAEMEEPVPMLFSAPKASVLVVDDNLVNLKVIDGLLKSFDIEADLAKSGKEAIEKVQQKAFDLVFMDHMMPGMDGVEAMHRIRKLDEQYENLPIVALTANAVYGIKNMFISEGFNDYVSKPIELLRLEKVLRRFIPAAYITEKENPSKTKQKEVVPESSDSELRIEDVNVAKGISGCAGNVERYYEVLDVFYKNGVLQKKQMEKLFKNESYQNLRIEVHSLKSTAASIGAEKLSMKAYDMENALKNENIGFVKEHFADLMERYTVLLAGLKEYFELHKTPDLPLKGSITKEIFMEKMDLIMNALENFNDEEAGEYLKDVMGYAYPANLTVGLDKLLSQIQLFNYEEAKLTAAALKDSAAASVWA